MSETFVQITIGDRSPCEHHPFTSTLYDTQSTGCVAEYRPFKANLYIRRTFVHKTYLLILIIHNFTNLLLLKVIIKVSKGFEVWEVTKYGFDKTDNHAFDNVTRVTYLYRNFDVLFLEQNIKFTPSKKPSPNSHLMLIQQYETLTKFRGFPYSKNKLQ